MYPTITRKKQQKTSITRIIEQATLLQDQHLWVTVVSCLECMNVVTCLMCEYTSWFVKHMAERCWSPLKKVIIPSKVCITWEDQNKDFPCFILRGYLHKTLCAFVLTMFCCCFMAATYQHEKKEAGSNSVLLWLQCWESELILQKWSQTKHFEQLCLSCDTFTFNTFSACSLLIYSSWFSSQKYDVQQFCFFFPIIFILFCRTCFLVLHTLCEQYFP